MPAATIGSVSYAADPDFSTTAKWVESVSLGAPEYLKAFPDAAGVDGTGVKRYGFRSRHASLNVVYCAGAEATCFSNALADFVTLQNSNFSCTIAGVSYPACELDAAGCSVEGEARPTGGGNFWCRARIAIVQTGLA